MYQTLLKPTFVDIKNFILDTLFPITCLNCGQEGNFICTGCKSTLSKLEHQLCIVCQKATPFGLTHSYCQTPFGADGLISFFNYHDEKVSNILIKGKYSFLPQLYKELGTTIAEKFNDNHYHILQAENYIITPIPLHPSRKRWRGFNQAEILSEALGEYLNLPMDHLLLRNKITKTQKDLKKEQRLKNISGAFTFKSPVNIRNKNIILVDDVTTTGATLSEAAKILKRNGASKVICLTVARD